MRFASFILLFAFGAIATAQPNPLPVDGKVVIPVLFTPAPLPKPLSRFYLTPQYKEMQPGNRIPGYMKSYMEQASFFSKDPEAEREAWNQMKLEDLPLDKIKKSGCIGGLAYYKDREAMFLNENNLIDFAPTGRPLSDVDEASRLVTSDWQIYFNIRRDGIVTLLPEVQKMRQLASALKVRMRYEIATKDFEKAAYSARTYFGLVQSFETNPTLIAGLVGLAIETVCLNAIEEMIQQTGCPNLYWSIAEIPPEAINLRTPIQGEKLLCQTLFGQLLNATGELPEAELKRILRQIDAFIYLEANGDKKKVRASAKYVQLAGDETKVTAARAYLIETGMNEKMVKSLSAMQAIVTADARHYESDLDDYFRVFGVTPAVAEKMATEMEAQWKANPDAILSGTLLPAANKVRMATTRLQQRIAYLRTLEAIRLHAHENKGRLPATLKEIKNPIPLDPVTGTDYQYAVKDNVATLTGGNPDPGQTTTNRQYEIRIRK